MNIYTKTKLFNLKKTRTKILEVHWMSFISTRFKTIKYIFWHDLWVNFKGGLLCRCMQRREATWAQLHTNLHWQYQKFYRIYVVLGIKLYPKIVWFWWYMPWLYFPLYYVGHRFFNKKMSYPPSRLNALLNIKTNACLIWYILNVRDRK